MKGLLFSFRGRINRSGFWKGIAIVTIACMILEYAAYRMPMYEYTSVIINLFIMYMLFAVTAKRYHDQDNSGWWASFWLIPIIGWVFIIIECGAGRGRLLKNQYSESGFLMNEKAYQALWAKERKRTRWQRWGWFSVGAAVIIAYYSFLVFFI